MYTNKHANGDGRINMSVIKGRSHRSNRLGSAKPPVGCCYWSRLRPFTVHCSLSAVTHAPFHTSMLRPASQAGPTHEAAGVGEVS